MIQYTDLCHGTHLLKNADFATTLKLFYIPNGTWIVMSALVMITTWNYLASALTTGKNKSE